ncbi:hypothetical protein ACSU1G_16250 [Microbacterium sp. A93]
MDLVRQWSRFRDVYGGADKEKVFEAMTPVAEKLGGLLHGAEIFAAAATTFDATIQTKQGKKEPYDYWARGWLTRLYEYDRDKNKVYTGEWEEEDYVQKHGKTPTDHFNALEQERHEHQQTAIDIYLTIEEARNSLADAVSAIDMGELSRLAYVNRTTALDIAGSPEELADFLEESHFFGGIDGLSEADYLEIAKSVPLQDLPYDYMDTDGLKWSYNGAGELVRSGSAEDPYLTYAVQLAIAQNEDYSDIELPNVTAPDGSSFADPPNMVEYLAAQGISVASGKIEGVPKSAIYDAAYKSIGLDKAGTKFFDVNATVITGLVSSGWNTKEFEKEFSEQNPLLSDEQVQTQTRRVLAQEVLTFLASGAVDAGAGAGVAALGVGGAPGWLLITLISWSGGQLATLAIDETFDQTWTEEERQKAYAEGELV